MYLHIVLCEKLSTSMQWITDQDKGVVCQPVKPCLKMRYPILEVIQYNNSDVQALSFASLDTYHGPSPEMFQIDLTMDTVTGVVWRISGG